MKLIHDSDLIQFKSCKNCLVDILSVRIFFLWTVNNFTVGLDSDLLRTTSKLVLTGNTDLDLQPKPPKSNQIILLIPNMKNFYFRRFQVHRRMDGNTIPPATTVVHVQNNKTADHDKISPK